ncbi:MAG: transposase [Proteobacteria bacterium]|nr:transposase [Pseudomonadota bacterium]
MPRQSRIDAPGALHHIIARGIEQRKIFFDEDDYGNFLKRLGGLIADTGTTCFAWALMPNHFHLLLKTGDKPISKLMQRLLTGYVVSFNKRHRRAGHLFQNRYKSILCQEELYLKELIRYIHLNPLRAKIVKSQMLLDTYKYCGHSTIMGNFETGWQETDHVLSMFAGTKAAARMKYEQFIKDGVSQGRRRDLIGGGLIRSIGGWDKVKSLRKTKEFLKSDERILGESDFVDTVLESAREKTRAEAPLLNSGITYSDLLQLAAELMHIRQDKIIGKNKEQKVVQARRLFCYWSVNELGMSMTQLGKILNVSVPTVSKAVKMGEQIEANENLDLPTLLQRHLG